MSKHRDRDGLETFAYIGYTGELYRVGYDIDGDALLHRASYSLPLRYVDNGDPFQD